MSSYAANAWTWRCPDLESHNNVSKGEMYPIMALWASLCRVLELHRICELFRFFEFFIAMIRHRFGSRVSITVFAG